MTDYDDVADKDLPDAALELASQELSAQSDFSAVFRGAGSAR